MNYKYYWLIIALMTLSNIGCDKTVEHRQLHEGAETVERQIHKIPIDKLEIVEVDGCEYIILKDKGTANQGFGYMAHKGNCKNPIHIYKSSKQDTVELSQIAE